MRGSFHPPIPTRSITQFPFGSRMAVRLKQCVSSACWATYSEGFVNNPLKNFMNSTL